MREGAVRPADVAGIATLFWCSSEGLRLRLARGLMCPARALQKEHGDRNNDSDNSENDETALARRRRAGETIRAAIERAEQRDDYCCG